MWRTSIVLIASLLLLASPGASAQAYDADLAKAAGGNDNGMRSYVVAEYHKFFGSAGLMMVNDIHNKIQKKK
jgi:hypothetical protein